MLLLYLGLEVVFMDLLTFLEWQGFLFEIQRILVLRLFCIFVVS